MYYHIPSVGRLFRLYSHICNHYQQQTSGLRVPQTPHPPLLDPHIHTHTHDYRLPNCCCAHSRETLNSWNRNRSYFAGNDKILAVLAEDVAALGAAAHAGIAENRIAEGALFVAAAADCLCVEGGGRGTSTITTEQGTRKDERELSYQD